MLPFNKSLSFVLPAEHHRWKDTSKLLVPCLTCRLSPFPVCLVFTSFSFRNDSQMLYYFTLHKLLFINPCVCGGGYSKPYHKHDTSVSNNQRSIIKPFLWRNSLSFILKANYIHLVPRELALALRNICWLGDWESRTGGEGKLLVLTLSVKWSSFLKLKLPETGE